MSNPDALTGILTMVLIFMIVILVILAGVFVYLRYKTKKRERSSEELETTKGSKNSSDAKKIAKEYTAQSIYKFLEFDKIEDNMIIQKNGNRYVMVIECQGVNYDLMSEMEKMSVEEGFLQFLNTIRHPIQIYVQTRTVNLNDSIENYKNKINELAIELEKKRNIYLKNLQSGLKDRQELEREFYEVTKLTNLYEYGKDVVSNTERMSLNKSVLNKKYYVIISYYPEEVNAGSFDKEEIKNMAFSELYTKSQSIIRTLAGCNVGGKILGSNDLVDLLYVAYNRDEAEVFSVDRAIRAGYDELYTTAPDVVDRKIKALDEEIERKALALVNQKVIQARSTKEQILDRRKESFEELIRQRAEMILKQNEGYLGKNTTDKAVELIKQEKTKEKGGDESASQEKKTRTRKKATSSSK